jgi:hypothetical protein
MRQADMDDGVWNGGPSTSRPPPVDAWRDRSDAAPVRDLLSSDACRLPLRYSMV